MASLTSSPSHLRKKRNFKALQLPSGGVPTVTSPNASSSTTTNSSSSTDPVATRLAPAPDGGMRRRPPPLDDNINNNPPIHGFLSAEPESAMVTSAARRNMRATISSTLATFQEKKRAFDLKNDELRNIEELGSGNGGSVMKVEHIASRTIMAKKVVLIDAKPSVRKQILRELQIMNDCDSPYIISSYGAYLAEPNICICMEFADKGSFDSIYKKLGPIDIQIVGIVAKSVLEGLLYLYNVHKIIHRDIKPSNILCNSAGEIKLCDFGVSGELVNSMAHTFVGTSIYMSPERIQGAEYSVKSDVWSLGITLIELAHGRFPFNDSYSDDEDGDDHDNYLPPPPPKDTDYGDDMMMEIDEGTPPPLPPKPSTIKASPLPPPSVRRESLQVPLTPGAARKARRKSKGVSLHGGGMMMSIIELMHQIVKEPAPRLGPEGRFPSEAVDFVDACLLKDIEERKTPKMLMEYSWIESATRPTVDLKAWAATF